MYYTAVLKHKKPNDYGMEYKRVKSTYLNEVVPGFFQRDRHLGGVHVIIVCAEQIPEFLVNIEWLKPKRISTSLNAQPATAETEYCIIEDCKAETLCQSILEISKCVQKCYGDYCGLKDMGEALANLEEVDEKKIWTKNQAEKITVRLREGLETAEETLKCRHTLYFVITMPEKAFMKMQSLSIPVFIEYIVLAEAEDPDIRRLVQENKNLKNENGGLDDKLKETKPCANSDEKKHFKSNEWKENADTAKEIEVKEKQNNTTHTSYKSIN